MQIKDSGKREVYESGAVRDIGVGKGRCDLLPMNVISKLMKDDVLRGVGYFTKTRNTDFLYEVLEIVMREDKPYLVLELSKHFEKGAVKYEERNWEKGIPTERYVDSAVRHYLKYLNGEEDEDHFIAFIWNVVCLIHTVEVLGDDVEK